MTGTVTADALDIGANNPRIRFDDSDTSNNGEITLDNTALRIESDEDNAVANSLITFRVDASERMRLDSSGRLGIGTSSPETVLQATASSAIIRLTSDTNGTSGVDFGDSDDTNIGRLLYDNSDNSMRFTTNAGERMRVLSGGGLTFNGDTAAANALDDYEQGSYTPSFSFTNGNGTLSVGAAVGSYTKIGNRVHLNFYIKIGTKGTASGDMRFSGLPYTPASVGNRYHSGSLWMNTTVSTAELDGNFMTMLLLSPGDATIRPYVMAGGGGVTHVNAGHVQNNTDFAVSMSFDTE